MERRTIFSITFLSLVIFLILLPIIQCQVNVNPNKQQQQQQGKKPLAQGLNSGNNKNIENIKNQKNQQNINSKTGKPDFQAMMDKLTPEQKQQILDRKAENQKIQEAEIGHDGVAEEVKPAVIDDPRTPQTSNPSACPDDESYEHFQLDLENGAVPDFLFLTSSTRPPAKFFAQFLSFHDNIRSPRIVEPNFFSYPWISKLNAKAYQAVYSNSLQTTDKSEIVGDFSSSYLFHPLTPKRIATQLPDMKVIIVLQNPIERAYQLYLDRVNDGLEFLTFEQIIQREFKEIATLRQTFRSCYNADSCNKNLCVPTDGIFISHDAEQTPRQLKTEVDVKDYLLTSYLFRSLYDDIVERWLNAFPRENIYVVTQEEFFKERFESGLKNITTLLGLPPHTFTREEKEEEEEMEEIEEEEEEEEKPILQPLNFKTQAALCKFFNVYNNRLSKLIGRELPWTAYCENVQSMTDKNIQPDMKKLQPFGAGGFVDFDAMKKPNNV